MILTDEQRSQLLLGLPLFFKDICLVFPPSVEEMVAMGLDKFWYRVNTLLLKKPEKVDNEALQEVIASFTNFEFILFLLHTDMKFREDFQLAFHMITHENVFLALEEKLIYVGPLSEKRALDDVQFNEFQEFLMVVFCLGDEEEAIEFKENDSPQVRALKETLLKGRAATKKAKAKQGKDGLKFSDLLASLATDLNYNLLNIKCLTYYAFLDQLRRMNWREEYFLDTRAMLAGAKLKKKVVHWIRAAATK